MGVWEIDAGRFYANFGAYGECIRILSGEIRCTPDDGGEPFTLTSGGLDDVPAGLDRRVGDARPPRKVYITWTAR